jgi:phosphoribosylaminoimidazole-succinocarboxamide synthase
MVDDSVLHKQLVWTIEKTDLPLGKREQGTDWDTYSHNKEKFYIATDRIIAFDRIVGTVPFKGQVLAALTAFFAVQGKEILPTDLLAQPRPNVLVVKNLQKLPISFVVQGYVTNDNDMSAWAQYQKGVRSYCGHALPAGLKENQKYPLPLMIPVLNNKLLSSDMILAEGIIDEEVFEEATARSLKLFAWGTMHATKHGLLLVQAQYDFALEDGKLVLLHGFHVPGNALYWDAKEYEKRFVAGEKQKALAQTAVQDWLERVGFQGHGPAPPMPDAIRIDAAKQYLVQAEKLLEKKIKLVSGDLRKELERVVK